MATIFVKDGFRVIIYPDDHEPPHVHVKKAGNEAKIQLDTIQVIKAWGFHSRDIAKIIEIIEDNQSYLLVKWYEIYG